MENIRKHGAIHMTLLDPEKLNGESATVLAKKITSTGSTAVMVGGSTSFSVHHLDEVVKAIKEATDLPIVLFPNDLAGVSHHAHAIFFMSLLNSSNPYYITGAQALGAPLVKKYGLEPIPMGYLIVGTSGTAAGFIGQAHPIPYERPELAAIYSLAAEYLGMRFVYLEAGSGASRPVPAEMIKAVGKNVSVPIIVGGGIKNPEQAGRAVSSGASVIVTGTLLEGSGPDKLKRIVKSIRKAAAR
jgi:phosphoglycerol geranylgeranyltransferase